MITRREFDDKLSAMIGMASTFTVEEKDKEHLMDMVEEVKLELLDEFWTLKRKAGE